MSDVFQRFNVFLFPSRFTC